MHELWKEVLTTTHPSTDKFLELDLKNFSALIPLPDYVVIKVTGSEAQTFLQGQLSNDITQLTPGNWQLTCQCNQKGRIISLIWLGQVEDGYLLCIPHSTLSACIADLKKYGAFSKVEIQEDHALICMGVAGKIPENLTHNALISMQFNNKCQQSVLIFCEDTFKTLIPHLEFHNEKLWNFLGINNYLAKITKSIQEEFLPHQLNLPSLGAVDFKKGCFKGQEIVARMEYLGKLKQVLHKAELRSDSTPKPGETIMNKNNASIGQYVNILSIAANKFLVLAVLNKEAIADIISLNNNQTLKLI